MQLFGSHDMSTTGPEERELQPLKSSGERQQQDKCRQQEFSDAVVGNAAHMHVAAHSCEADCKPAAQQVTQSEEQTEISRSEVQRSPSTA